MHLLSVYELQLLGEQGELIAVNSHTIYSDLMRPWDSALTSRQIGRLTQTLGIRQRF